LADLKLVERTSAGQRHHAIAGNRQPGCNPAADRPGTDDADLYLAGHDAAITNAAAKRNVERLKAGVPVSYSA
jgi:hypothetical protein